MDTEVKKREFLERFPDYRTITYTAKAIGIGRQTVYDWFNSDPDFKANFQATKQEELDHYLKLLDEYLDRPIQERAVQQAEANLLMFRIKQLDPSFKDNYKIEIETGDRLASILEKYHQAKEK